MHLRSFPHGARNCYTIPVSNGNKYLIRPSFMYGNYDGLLTLPTFDLYLGVNLWTSVNFSSEASVIWNEIITVSLTDSLSLCLVNTNLGVPFISVLEVRPIDNSMYPFVTQLSALSFHNRLNAGGGFVRFPQDPYDRIWFSWNSAAWTPITTSSSINVMQDVFQPSLTVMQTASSPKNSSSMSFSWEAPPNQPDFMYFLHFAELQILSANESRMFNINLNGQHWFGPVNLRYLFPFAVQPTRVSNLERYFFELQQTSNSTLPPLINALEIYIVKLFMELTTVSADVNAVQTIKTAYHIRRNWMGDPCTPSKFSWDGINCSRINSAHPPSITLLNLSSSGLTGEISPYIANLTSLNTLDLSNNGLTGNIPNFLGEMPSLKFLYLFGNCLNGSIPESIVNKSNNGTLTLSIDNLDACGIQKSDKKKMKLIIPTIVISLLSVVAITSALLVAIRKFHTKKQEVGMIEREVDEADRSSYATASEGWQFSYNEIIRITNNFEVPIGEGGFGVVFNGCLSDGTQVAVKMLKSLNQDHGLTFFRNELKLLMKIQHDNLVPFTGYCDDGVNKALICEFMPGGDLKKFLSGTIEQRKHLIWKQRIQIALGAARGLEYLHCQLHLVHRDLKPENILLNENLEVKITDFGLGKIFSDENVSRIVTGVAGTIGYIDPDYYINEVLSYKSDVYSFGVVLLQLITGRPAILIRRSSPERLHLVQWLGGRSNMSDIVDPSLEGNYHMMSIQKAIGIGEGCTKSSSTDRPTMSQVIYELEACLKIENTRHSPRLGT